LVGKTGICKISGFGISKQTDDIDEQNMPTFMEGTVSWMAPEAFDYDGTGNLKRGYNSKVDIWSVGCVVLEMWSGKLPWGKDTVLDVIVKVRVVFHFSVNWNARMMHMVSCILLSKLLQLLRV
jgi:serine/threonine protein kinase